MNELNFRDYKISILNTNDSKSFFKLLDSNRKRLEAFFAGTVSKTETLECTQEYCKIIEKKIQDKSYFPYIIIDKVTGKFIGLIDVKNIDWNIPKAEIGYFIDTNYEGKGVISESVGRLIDYLVETFHFKKLLCRVNGENIGSIKVAQKNKFELEGIIRRDYRTTHGELVDLNYYGRLF